MTIKLFSYLKSISGICLASLLIAGCGGSNQNSPEKHKYLLIINGEKGSRDEDRMLWFDSLDSNLVLHTDRASMINNKLGSTIILNDHFLLSIDKKSGLFSKYQYAEDGLKRGGELKLEDFEYISFTTKLDSTLLYIGGRGHKNISSYAIIDQEKMLLVQKGRLDLPVAAGQNASDNFGMLKNNHLYVGYSSFGEDYDHCSDTSYLAVLDYPALKLKSVDKDVRSAFPGSGVNGMFNFFADAKEDLYVLTSPVFYHGNHPTASTAFYRISNGKGEFDKEYFFDLSEQLNGIHLLGITQAAAGKVILATISFPSTGKSDYYVADVYKKTIKLLLKNQNQPNFVWGTSGFYDGVNASFIVNESQGKARMYVYDGNKDILRPGPAIEGNVSSKSSYLILNPSKKDFN
jgi:hypothetical protein